MKAGIYKTPNGNYVYVNTARTIKAETGRMGLVGQKPSFQNGGEAGIVGKEGQSLDLRRVSDSPMGLCNGVAIMTYLDSIGVDYTTDERRPGEITLKSVFGKQHDELKRHVVNEQVGQIIADKSPLSRPTSKREAKTVIESTPAGESPVSEAWAKGREDKQFSRHVVYGHGPGFLSEQGAAAERWLITETAKLQQLADRGVLRHTAHDEWEIVDADAYAAFLNGIADPPLTQRSVGMPHTLGMGYGIDAIDKDGNAVVFKTASTPGKTTNQQIDIYKQFARDIYGVTDADRERMRALGFRPCHKQSARKHRKAGHIVVGEGSGVYWWMKKVA